MFNYWTLDIDENDDHEGDANVVDVDAYMYVVMVIRMKMIVMMMSDNRGLVQISDLDTTICRGGIVVEPNPNLSPHTLIIYPTSQKYHHFWFQIALKIHNMYRENVLV